MFNPVDIDTYAHTCARHPHVHKGHEQLLAFIANTWGHVYNVDTLGEALEDTFNFEWFYNVFVAC